MTTESVRISLVSCDYQEQYPKIRLSDLDQPPRAKQTETSALKVALATGLSPSQSLARYQAVTDYLRSKLGKPVESVQRKTYAQVDDLLREGQVDLAFVCSSSYVIGREAFGEKLIAVPVIRGIPHYQAVIIVNAASPIHSFDELKGKSMALMDPQSTSGALYFFSKVTELGGLSYLKSHIYTYSHDYSIHAVRDGLVDGASVDSNVLAAAMEREPQLKTSLRVIDTSPLFANNPVVASPKIDATVFDQVRRWLLTMESDSEGRSALLLAGMDRFVILADEQYESVRRLVQKTQAQR